MIIQIPKQKTKIKQKQLERALAILKDIGAEEMRPEPSYGISRFLDKTEDKSKVAMEIGNLFCTRIFKMECKNCPVGKVDRDCIARLGMYLATKGPKRRA